MFVIEIEIFFNCTSRSKAESNFKTEICRNHQTAATTSKQWLRAAARLGSNIETLCVTVFMMHVTSLHIYM